MIDQHSGKNRGGGSSSGIAATPAAAPKTPAATSLDEVMAQLRSNSEQLSAGCTLDESKFFDNAPASPSSSPMDSGAGGAAPAANEGASAPVVGPLWGFGAT